MGLSDAGANPHSLGAAAAAAADVAGVLAALGVSRTAVVGHDWGGAVGATLALEHRDLATQLVFIESGLAGSRLRGALAFRRAQPRAHLYPVPAYAGPGGNARSRTLDAFLHHLWNTFTGDKTAAPFEAWAPYLAAIRRPGQFSSSADYYRSAYTSADDTKRLLADGKLTIPVLPIAGEKSFGSANEAMARNFAGDVRPGLVFSGAGHFVPEERPLELLAALQNFLA
jgi:pimeloyl-ACP methyl ester carboxylesterase